MRMTQSPAWYAVRVAPRHEKTVAKVFRLKEVEEFVPLYKARRRWADRFKTVELPAFPGYVFCRLEPRQYLAVVSTSGVIEVLGNGREPIAVPDKEIEDLRQVIESGLECEPWQTLLVGDRVKLIDGPLAGLEGSVSQVTDRLRLVVSVTMLQRSMLVTIDPGWVIHEGAKSHPLLAAAAARQAQQMKRRTLEARPANARLLPSFPPAGIRRSAQRASEPVSS